MDMSLSNLRETVEDRGAWFSPWGHQESNMIYWLNKNNNLLMFLIDWMRLFGSTFVAFFKLHLKHPNTLNVYIIVYQGDDAL